MGIIRVQTPNEGIVRVQIKGDEPTEQEIQAIRNQFGAPKREAESFQDLVDKYKGDAPQTGAEAQKKIIEQEFDTTTGVRDFGLRAALSVAEKPEEEDAIMNSYAMSCIERKKKIFVFCFFWYESYE